MDKQEATNALTEFKTFLSKLTGSKEKAEDVIVEAELSEAVEETVEETVEAVAEETVAVEEPVSTELSAEEPSYITKEEFVQFQAELTSVLKDAMETMKSEKAELSKEVAELSAQPAADAIVHSPELSSENVTEGRTHGHKRPHQTIDRVLEKLSKYNK